jgi:hypothetical protein
VFRDWQDVDFLAAVRPLEPAYQFRAFEKFQAAVDRRAGHLGDFAETRNADNGRACLVVFVAADDEIEPDRLGALGEPRREEVDDTMVKHLESLVIVWGRAIAHAAPRRSGAFRSAQYRFIAALLAGTVCGFLAAASAPSRRNPLSRHFCANSPSGVDGGVGSASLIVGRQSSDAQICPDLFCNYLDHLFLLAWLLRRAGFPLATLFLESATLNGDLARRGSGWSGKSCGRCGGLE